MKEQNLIYIRKANKMARKSKELKGVKIYQWDNETIRIFSRLPKFATSISNNPNSVRYHKTLYKKLKEILND